MEEKNQTSVTEFILLGLTNELRIQIPLFVLFLLFYFVTVAGNISIAALIVVEPRLHTPMYFLLSNLSLSDFCYASVIAPNMLVHFFSSRKVISYSACAAQTYFFGVFASTEGYMLAAMAYDRYAAICHPLLYPVIISKKVCIQLVAAVYLGALLTAAVYTGSTFHSTFCGPNIINHFFCDMIPLMKLSCSDTFVGKTMIFAVGFIFGFTSLLIMFISYAYIIAAILRISTNEGRPKAFSTCGSHMTVVLLFYGTALFMYLRLPSSDSGMQDKVVSVFYTLVNPMLNPMIYSLRNQEVKGALWKRVTCNYRGQFH
ncbi:olfactory receptor 5AR1-like [Lissotriton helveticus]